METQRTAPGTNYTVSTRTALLIDAMKGLDAVYYKLYRYAQEINEPSAETLINESIAPRFDALKSKVKEWLAESVEESLFMDGDKEGAIAV